MPCRSVQTTIYCRAACQNKLGSNRGLGENPALKNQDWSAIAREFGKQGNLFMVQWLDSLAGVDIPKSELKQAYSDSLLAECNRLKRDRFGNVENLRALLKYDLNPNAADTKSGKSALRFLCEAKLGSYYGQAEFAEKRGAIRALLKRGVKPGAGDLPVVAEDNPELARQLLGDFVEAGMDLKKESPGLFGAAQNRQAQSLIAEIKAKMAAAQTEKK